MYNARPVLDNKFAPQRIYLSQCGSTWCCRGRSVHEILIACCWHVEATRMQATSAFSNNNDNNDDDNDNNNNNSNKKKKKKKYRTERRNSRFFVICSLRREPSPTRTFNGPGAIVCKSRATHRALITCNMSCYVPRDMN